MVFGDALPPVKPHGLPIVDGRRHSVLLTVLSGIELVFGALVHGQLALGREPVIQQRIQIHLSFAYVIFALLAILVSVIKGAGVRLFLFVIRFIDGASFAFILEDGAAAEE